MDTRQEQRRLEALERENRALKNILNRRRREYAYIDRIRKLTGAGYGWYEEIPEEYEDTIYKKKRFLVEQYAKGNLSKEFFFQIKMIAARKNKNSIKLELFLCCCGILPKEGGICLILKDPYGKIITEPVPENTIKKDVSEIIGTMLLIKIRVRLDSDTYEPLECVYTGIPYREA